MTPITAPSPNFNDRKRPVSMIILHYTGMETGQAALERLCDPAAQVSAHYMIEEDGRVFQLVDEAKRAWHAGLSFWKGERDVNSASIGIEIVNGGHDFGLPDFPSVQLDAVFSLVSDIRARHGVLKENVVGHSDIAPERKYDPGEKFPWRALAERGDAIWPDDPPDLADIDPGEALTAIGYDPEADLSARLAAFQRRFRPHAVTGEADAVTLALLSAVRDLTTQPRLS